MNHYTYMIKYSNGKKYVGVRSCECLPEEDTSYVGSSKYTPNDLIVSKEILAVFATRKEAVNHEIYLHELYDVVKNDEFYNRSKQTSTKFDTTGLQLEFTEEHKEKISEALKGRKRSKEVIKFCMQRRKEIQEKRFKETGRRTKPKSEETKKKISEAKKGKSTSLKGIKRDSEYKDTHYASRRKYGDKYLWIHDSGKREYKTCFEMGDLYGTRKTKPASVFRCMVKGEIKSHNGWRLGQV